jgi:uncharacterized protein YyaL (SSP411 family)
MFVSAYFDAWRAFGWNCGGEYWAAALKTVNRMLDEAWTENSGFAHRIGGPALPGSLDDQVFGVLALLDAYEAGASARCFSAAQRTMDITIQKYGDHEHGGFFDRSADAPPMGGLEVRRKPFQDSPTPGANSVATIALIRMHAYTDDQRYHDFAKKTLEAFAGVAPQYGLFAASYGLAASLLGRRLVQVVISGPEGDDLALQLEEAANSVYRLGKAVLHFSTTSSRGIVTQPRHLPLALRETLSHLPKEKSLALVCTGNTCLSPTSDPAQLTALLENGAAGVATL